MRLEIKRAMYDGAKLHDPGIVDVSSDFTPPRDARVWDGNGFVPVPLNEDKTVDMDELSSIAVDVPLEEDEDDLDLSIPKKTRARKK